MASTNNLYSKPIYTPYAIDSTMVAAILSSMVLGAFVQAILVGSVVMITATTLHIVWGGWFKKSKKGG